MRQRHPPVAGSPPGLWRLRRWACIALVPLSFPLAAPGAGFGKSGLRVAGTCGKVATSSLKVASADGGLEVVLAQNRARRSSKLSPEDGRIEVEVEVDQNRNRVPWKVVIWRNGRIAATVAAITRAPSGSFTVRRLVTNGTGRDVIRATATRLGETCSVRAAI